ncbi:hypothetical protein CHARACLAT_021551 [Characodon lateralis]|uniref:Uncharacterized protein n=1 Tax=Characodon lateralis TaxID=208331 RepID=A0ABU7EL28_9TELE|nr:hypothetical protein [Characodon lateralis]
MFQQPEATVGSTQEGRLSLTNSSWNSSDLSRSSCIPPSTNSQRDGINHSPTCIQAQHPSMPFHPHFSHSMFSFFLPPKHVHGGLQDQTRPRFYFCLILPANTPEVKFSKSTRPFFSPCVSKFFRGF